MRRDNGGKRCTLVVPAEPRDRSPRDTRARDRLPLRNRVNIGNWLAQALASGLLISRSKNNVCFC